MGSDPLLVMTKGVVKGSSGSIDWDADTEILGASVRKKPIMPKIIEVPTISFQNLDTHKRNFDLSFNGGG